MMLPPTSARKAVRLRNASTILGLCSVYGYLTSAWVSLEGGDKQDRAHVTSTWRTEFRRKLVALMEKIQDAQALTQLARWEGNVRGHRPVEEYVRLEAVQLEVLSSLGQVRFCWAHRRVL